MLDGYGLYKYLFSDTNQKILKEEEIYKQCSISSGLYTINYNEYLAFTYFLKLVSLATVGPRFCHNPQWVGIPFQNRGYSRTESIFLQSTFK